MLWLPDPIEPHLRNCTLTSTKTVLIEPLFGVPAYTENETFSLISYYKGRVYPFARLVTYKDTDETKAEGLENAKAAQEGIQLLEVQIPTIFGVVAIILAIVFALNIRRLKRKKPPQPKTQPPPSP